MTAVQLQLFRLPAVGARTPVTTAQLALLDALVLSDGRPPIGVLRLVLRVLLRKGWVERFGSAPAVYRVTACGRAARVRGHANI
jgi:hypothetical protein